MQKYYFYSKNDASKEPIFTITAKNRMMAARRFAMGKQMSLKQFLNLYSVSR